MLAAILASACGDRAADNAAAASPPGPPEKVRFAGTWYQIERTPSGTTTSPAGDGAASASAVAPLLGDWVSADGDQACASRIRFAPDRMIAFPPDTRSGSAPAGGAARYTKVSSTTVSVAVGDRTTLVEFLTPTTIRARACRYRRG